MTPTAQALSCGGGVDFIFSCSFSFKGCFGVFCFVLLWGVGVCWGSNLLSKCSPTGYSRSPLPRLQNLLCLPVAAPVSQNPDLWVLQRPQRTKEGGMSSWASQSEGPFCNAPCLAAALTLLTCARPPHPQTRAISQVRGPAPSRKDSAVCGVHVRLSVPWLRLIKSCPPSRTRQAALLLGPLLSSTVGIRRGGFHERGGR